MKGTPQSFPPEKITIEVVTQSFVRVTSIGYTVRGCEDVICFYFDVSEPTLARGYGVHLPEHRGFEWRTDGVILYRRGDEDDLGTEIIFRGFEDYKVFSVSGCKIISVCLVKKEL